MVQTPAKPLTLEAFLALPETQPASEFIDGQVIQKPMPKIDHSTIQLKLAAAIDLSLSKEKRGGAFPELRCTFDGRSIVPDIAVLSWPAIPRTSDGRVAGDLAGAPTWIVEILSAGQSQTKVTKKILNALDHGSELGWLIDPSENCVFVYTPPNAETALYESPEAILPVPDFAKVLSLSVGDLFSWLYGYAA